MQTGCTNSQSRYENDPKLRVVYREWPILSKGSLFAARAALAAREQGKYEALHWELMGIRGRIDEAIVIQAATKIGLDIEKLKTDMLAPNVDAHIEKSMQLAQLLNFSWNAFIRRWRELCPGTDFSNPIARDD